MGQKMTASAAIASAALALATSGAIADEITPVTWNTDVNNSSWAVDANWTTVPNWVAGTDVVKFESTTTGGRTTTLDGDRTAHSLVGYGSNSRVYTVNPGDPATSRLILTSGDITVTTNNGDGRTVFDLSNITLQVGSLDSAIEATWDQSVGTASNSQVTTRVGKLLAHKDTVIEVTGTGSAVTFNQSNSAFLGTFTVDTAVRGGQFTINADDGMGVGTVYINADHGGIRLGDGTTHATNFVLNNTSTPTHIYVGTGESATITSALTGTGGLATGRARVATTAQRGTLILEGDNTLSGPVTSSQGTLRINGTWTNAGSFSITSSANALDQYLEGHGTIGMGAGKTVTLSVAGNTNITAISPGTTGSVGILTIGTEENGNAVVFSGYSGLRIDLDGDDSDTLAVIGDVNLASLNDQLWIHAINTPTAPAYTILTYTGQLTDTFNSVYYDGQLIADPTAPGAIGGVYHLAYGNGTVQLVPEPAALGLLSLGALAMLRRRR